MKLINNIFKKLRIIRALSLSYDNALAELQERGNKIQALQAKIDALMLEYCPDEMTEEQKVNWKNSQKPEGNNER